MKKIKNIIRIDDEVRHKLEEKAREFDMDEETTLSAILRKILGMDPKIPYSHKKEGVARRAGGRLKTR